ncbi:hypothetical protein [Phreatobacter stygius]|uniref:Uncharacterized protein n=1 Tax=Phreatobacter stygius TaxID=1940610 RepID=A0A4D7B4Z6_9HYPH|nr:hypothetical protein [Phreatobacter stygius]QCI65528.1 hypothetical protein E8M01_15730 [Phreatobacter stygius]
MIRKLTTDDARSTVEFGDRMIHANGLEMSLSHKIAMQSALLRRLWTVTTHALFFDDAIRDAMIVCVNEPGSREWLIQSELAAVFAGPAAAVALVDHAVTHFEGLDCRACWATAPAGFDQATAADNPAGRLGTYRRTVTGIIPAGVSFPNLPPPTHDPSVPWLQPDRRTYLASPPMPMDRSVIRYDRPA